VCGLPAETGDVKKGIGQRAECLPLTKPANCPPKFEKVQIPRSL